MPIGSVAGESVSVTGLRELLSNLRVPKDNPKSSNSAQICRLLYLSGILERKPDAANKGHTQVKERGDRSGSFTIASALLLGNERLQAVTSRSLQTKIKLFLFHQFF